MSLLSFPVRGTGGSAKWPGNCAPQVYEWLLTQLRPQTFADVMSGSGTGNEVARRMGIESVALDLHSGFNVLRDPIRLHLPQHWQGGADLTFSHPPYWNIVTYSGVVYGEAHPDDLSRSASLEDFMEKLAHTLLNQRDATRVGGHYGTLLGDVRQSGQYYALASDLQAYLPQRERRAILIKAQHNTRTGHVHYPGLRYGRIEHETILLYERTPGGVYWVLASVHNQQQQTRRSTWKAVIRQVLSGLGETFTNQEVYEGVLQAAPEKVRQAPHHQAKIRQVLQGLPELRHIERGRWAKCA